MVLGIGNDIVKVARIKSSIDQYQDRFLNRVFTASEQEYCLARKEAALHFAGRFAAKEAVAKALGTGFSGGITWLDIEVVNDEKGKPYLVLSSKLLALFGNPRLSISISHCDEYATAFAIWIPT